MLIFTRFKACFSYSIRQAMKVYHASSRFVHVLPRDEIYCCTSFVLYKTVVDYAATT
jgi:hypothetical protein